MEKYTLITGATSGIGEALAIELSKSSNLLLIGRNQDKINNVLQKCSLRKSHKFICCDLNKEKQSVFLILNEFLQKESVEVESFVHCAGITKILPFRNFSITNTDEIFNVNLFSAIEILRALLKKNNHGSLKNVVVVSSLWSIRGEAGNSIYAASKGALNALIFSLAKELAPKVRINAVLPGAVKTQMTEKLLNSENGLKQLDNYPLGFGAPSDIVNLIKFLLSNESAWITGQAINIDGGRSIL